MHDLRNSLSAIRLGVELIGKRAQSPEFDGVLAHVDSAASRAHAHSEALADVCRLAAGQGLAAAITRFSLHAVVRQTLDAASPPSAAQDWPAVEHDRFGEGDCVGDPVRIAQFLTLALEEVAVVGPSNPLIVISEIEGERFRVTVLGGAGRGAFGHQDPDPARALPGVRRRVLMQGIASAHGGHVAFDRQHAGRPAIDGRFVSAAAAPL